MGEHSDLNHDGVVDFEDARIQAHLDRQVGLDPSQVRMDDGTIKPVGGNNADNGND